MPKGDTWPGGVAMEPLSNMDSAGSCDSVISVNSACSEDSMEHLSAEERACLMYLEETIEALEVQEDSGLSNDELETERHRKTLDDIAVESEEVPASVTCSTTDSSPRPPSADSGGEQLAPDQTSEPQSVAEPETLGRAGSPLPDAAPAARTEAPATGVPADMDLSLIPPPSDFMDEPLPQPEAASSAKDSPAVPQKPKPTIDLELLRRRASERAGSAVSPVTPEPSKPEAPAAAQSPPAVASVTMPTLVPPPEAAEPRSPPAVAPKPKRLPANIILKSHKVSESGPAPSPPASSERLLMDPQRHRMEALRKLGLLKSDEADPAPAPAPAVAPKLSPQHRSSWTAPHSPVRPVSPPPSFIPAPPPAVSAAPAILPAPAAFCDPVLSEPGPPDATRPALVKQPTPPKVKSATLERSGPGLSSYMADQGSDHSRPGGGGGGGQPSLSQLRNSRPRPASLGSGKEFSSARGGGLQVSPGTPPPPPPPQPAGDSQKLPRSQGISVLICPRSENEGKRREALKKLGLLRD